VLQQCTPVMAEIGIVRALQGALGSIEDMFEIRAKVRAGRSTYNPCTLAPQIMCWRGRRSHHALLKQPAQPSQAFRLSTLRFAGRVVDMLFGMFPQPEFQRAFNAIIFRPGVELEDLDAAVSGICYVNETF
jgi:hypothetical protein